MYKRAERGWLKHLDFILLDLICLQGAFIIAYMIRHTQPWPYADPRYASLALVMSLMDVVVAAAFNTMHNVLKRGYFVEFVETLRQSLILLAGMSLYMFSMQSGDVYSRITVFLTSAFHLALGYCMRLVWKRVVLSRKVGTNPRSVLLVCDTASAPDIVRLLHAHPTDNVALTGLVLTDRDQEGGQVAGEKVVATLDNAAEYICRGWVDEVLFVPGEGRDPARLLEQCREMGITVHLQLPLQREMGQKTFVEKLGGFQVLTSSVNYGSPLELFLKRLLDILGGLVGSLVALIIMAVVGQKIKKASPGPILYRQERIGQNGRRFKMIKIRSMYLDADERKKELMAQNRVSDGMMFKLDWDPRIIGNEILPDGTKKTGIGEFIRSTSLDEFPQFFNVLAGDMSLVGTRPPTVDEWEKYELHHRARLAVKPGITGMWQVSGRSEITDFEEVVKLDTQYIENWNLGLDVKILFKTIGVVLRHKGAM